MAHNPLFPGTSDPVNTAGPAGVDPFAPAGQAADQSSANPAAALIRSKLQDLYSEEPDAAQEAVEAAHHIASTSRHQRYMQKLSASGLDQATIQTAWHDYYAGLSDAEKHEVWQEFYDSSASIKAAAAETPSAADDTAAELPVPAPGAGSDPFRSAKAHVSDEDRASLRSVINDVTGSSEAVEDTMAPAEKKIPAKHVTPTERRKMTARHHLQSLLFGLATGAVILFVLLFSFFNEVIIAPFIQPGRASADTPIIVGTGNQIAADKTAKVIIPKINLEIPLDFSIKTTDEGAIENALDGGVVHYPTTKLPGQKGNAAFFGHSSNNIFNSGKYKFAFVLLHQLVPGDTFYLTYNGTAYAYQVYDKKIVKPSEVGVLNDVAGKTATATLITCDPPGTSINRLVVWGEQVNPNPNTNTASTTATNTASSGQPTKSAQLPANGETLWTRLVNRIVSIF